MNTYRNVCIYLDLSHTDYKLFLHACISYQTEFLEKMASYLHNLASDKWVEKNQIGTYLLNN